MEYYNVLDRSEFCLTVKYCPDIVDLTDAFMNVEQLVSISEDFNSDSYMRSHAQKIYFDHAISELCKKWIGTIKEGCISTRKVPADVTRMIDAIGIHRVNDTLRAFRNRDAGIRYTATPKEIRNADARPKRPYQRSDRLLVRDYKNLIKFCMLCMREKHHVTFEWNLYPSDAENIIRFCKKNMSWSDVLHAHKHNRGHYNFYPKEIAAKDMIWIKKIWDSPELVRVFIEHVIHTTS